MIESRLDPLLDGISCGPEGSNLSLVQIASLFHGLAEEGLPRSVSAALRICREQSQDRREIAALRWSWAFAVPGSLLFIAILTRVPHGSLGVGVFFSLLLFGPFVVYAIRERTQIVRSRAQLGELRRLTLDTLDSIALSPWFVPERLDRENAKTLRSLWRTDPAIWERVTRILLGEWE